MHFLLDKHKKYLAFAQEILTALENLGYYGDLDITRLTDDELNIIKQLILAFARNQPVTNLPPNLPSAMQIQLRGLNFIIIYEKHETLENTYYLKNFFTTEIEWFRTNEKGEKTRVCQYASLRSEDILSISNIRFDTIISSFKKFGENESNIIIANFFFLELLKAYDASNDQRKDILNAALSFSEWLYSLDDEILDRSIKTLNYLQTIKRLRALTEEEQELLCLMTEDNKEIELNITAAYLLLDEKTSAKRHYMKMPAEQKEYLKEFPIWRFWT